MTSLTVSSYSQRVSSGGVDAGQRHQDGPLTCADTHLIRVADE
jgi:hypothetical protein